jgi:hypothetical protein
MDDNSDGDCPFRVIASIHRGVGIQDCRSGKGWALTNEQACNLLDAITLRLRQAQDHYVERLRRWPPLEPPKSWG